MKTRNTQEELIMLKKRLLNKCIERKMKQKDAAKLIGMHPKAFSRLKRKYLEHGIVALVPRKPGPKQGAEAINRTAKEIEDIVVAYGLRYRNLGPIPLSEKIEDECAVRLNQSTIWRILRRRKIRYGREYKRWKKEPKLYCLDQPGIELQLDGCYPYGRSKKTVVMDAIDDCSRWVYGRIYEHEDADSAIDFVSHLVQKAPFRIQRIRVDNRYGKRLRDFCQNLGIQVKENDAYCPEQNGKIERFHKTLKNECFWASCSYQDNNEVIQYKLQLWLEHYNKNRRHGGLGMKRMTPFQKIATTYVNLLPLTYPQKVTLSLQQYNV